MEDLRNSAVNEAATVSDFIKGRLGYPNINFASIGMWCPSSTCTSSVGDPTTLLAGAGVGQSASDAGILDSRAASIYGPARSLSDI